MASQSFAESISSRTTVEESDSSEDDTGIEDWKPPSVEVGDTLLIMQYPDLHDNQHPIELKTKVHKVDGARVYYRVDPTLDTHRFVSGAGLVKFYEEEQVSGNEYRNDELRNVLVLYCFLAPIHL